MTVGRLGLVITVPTRCTDTPPPPPPAPSLTLSANPATVVQGNSSMLSWVSSNTTSCTASGGWSGTKTLNGNESVSPTATTTYTLMCVGAGGTTTQSVMVGVTLPPSPQPALSFSATPAAITEGQSSTLAWDSTDAMSCTASQGWSGTKTFDGNEVVSPTQTTTYQLDCSGPGGSVQKTATVTVTPLPPPVPTVSLMADPTTTTQGASSTLTWSSTNATNCMASDGWSGARALSGSESVAPSATTTYTLVCTGEGGAATGTASVYVMVPPPPPPPTGALLISEVLYDLNLSTTSPQGTESANEWVEIHNGTNAPIDLSAYTIHDSAGSDTIPDGTTLAAGQYLVITATSTTASFWSIPAGALVLVINSNIGNNGLGNDGDMVELRNAGGVPVDAVSWGTNVSAFDPSVTDVPNNSGSSIARSNLTTDTNTAADWAEDTTPSPGM